MYGSSDCVRAIGHRFSSVIGLPEHMMLLMFRGDGACRVIVQGCVYILGLLWADTCPSDCRTCWGHSAHHTTALIVCRVRPVKVGRL
jgi:hypothetical protein